MIISREGNSITMKTDEREIRFMTVVKNTCQNSDLRDWDAPNVLDHQISAILEHINRASFFYTHGDNPNVQYGIARYCETKHPLDRVYGIMQIYNLRVGEAARPGAKLTLDEFAATISSDSPVLGQLFVHSTRPDYMKSWRITQYSTVPRGLLSYRFNDTEQLCSIVVDTAWRATAKGNINPTCEADGPNKREIT